MGDRGGNARGAAHDQTGAPARKLRTGKLTQGTLLETVLPTLVRMGKHPERHIEVDLFRFQVGRSEIGADRGLHVDALFDIFCL